MIKDTYEMFKTLYDRANINRDISIDQGCWLAAGTARVQYLVQIVASIISVPFLILAGLYDLLKGDCSPLHIPITVFTHLLIILPVSILGAILPMSWSRFCAPVPVS